MNGKTLLIVAAGVLIAGCNRPKPIDWGDYNVLGPKLPRHPPPSYHGTQISGEEYLQWVQWGEEWFRSETFGNERVWTDVVGLLNGTVDVPSGGNTYRREPVFKYLLQAVDALDGKPGNLFTGNGGGYTSDLVITFPAGTLLNKTFPVPEKLHTGLDVEAGEPWPLGIVPRRAPAEEEALPYLLDPEKFSSGPAGVGHIPGGGKFRIGLSCALCHFSLDVDWDGKPDLKSAKPTDTAANGPYRPEHAWAIGNQDILLGWIFALSSNTVAGFENSGAAGKTTPSGAREWARWVLANYTTHPEETEREVNRGLLMFPRGFADDTPDGLHNSLQFPSLFTHMNWPYNYDGVMLNASDRNNNVWTTGLDLTQLVSLCKDRGGATSKLAFWEEQGLYSELTAEQYADIVVCHSPAVMFDSTQKEKLKDDILGVSDGVPGLLSTDAVVLINGIPGVIPDKVFNNPDNAKFNRIRTPAQFGPDGDKRGPMVGLLGVRVATPPSVRREYHVDDLEKKYGLNGDEFLTECVSMMLDWVEPPPNTSALLSHDRDRGLVKEGYEVFKNLGCAGCHAGPYLTDNLIYPMNEIGTNIARAKSTELLQALAPPYNPRTGEGISSGIIGVISNLFGGKKPGYKTVTLRYLWGSAPYLHDGGVAVALRLGSLPAGDELRELLQRPDTDKTYGVGQILLSRESHPETCLRANAALSLQALVLKSEREKVIAANNAAVWPVPGTDNRVPMSSLQIQGVGHEYWVDDVPGGTKVTALVAFLLALDDDPGR